MNNRYLIAVVLGVQVLCAVFFASQILAAIVDLPFGPIDWALYELIEIGAAVGLLIGIIMGAIVLRSAWARTARAESALRLASGAFMEVLEERFAEWGLTPAERDVALFAIKGMSTAEIAALRETSEGTVKAQTNAIYRKAGVSGRPQLLSLFIDDLMADGS
ncbi:MAG: LuxR C-terminal-related transcriptional regulator [Pseudomonadota bacterium]